MKFSFEIDIEDIYDGHADDNDFKKAVFDGAVTAVADMFYNDHTSVEDVRSDASKAVTRLISEHSAEIIAAVVDKVSEKITRKRALVELTPKARDVAAISEENRDYFMQLIDEAIAKRFGK